MNTSSFDRLTRLLVTATARRGLGGALLGTLLGLAGATLPAETTAHDARKRCRRFRGRKKRNCMRKARRHNRRRHGPAPAECDGPEDCTDVLPACAQATCVKGTCGTVPKDANQVCRAAVPPV